MSILARLQRVARRAVGAPPRGPAATRNGKAAGGNRDNRVAPRLSRESTAQLLHYPAGRHTAPINVQVTDYSATGIGVIHTESLLIGKTFVVREPHVTKRNTCIFTVVRSDPRPDGMFSIGLHVGNSLSNEHTPLLEIPAAPGISRGSKILFTTFALIGIALIVAGMILKHRAG
jgi:hypothetical protein